MSKVTLVEDDATMRSLLKTLLEWEGHQVHVFGTINAEELFPQLLADLPDFLLLDVHLNGANGIDLLRQLKNDQRFQGLRVIMSSGMDVGDRCLQAGADGFLMKPYMPNDLISMLRAPAK